MPKLRFCTFFPLLSTIWKGIPSKCRNILFIRMRNNIEKASRQNLIKFAMLKNCKGKERLQCFCDTIKIPNEDTFFVVNCGAINITFLLRYFSVCQMMMWKRKPGLQIVNDKTYKRGSFWKNCKYLYKKIFVLMKENIFLQLWWL